MFRSSKKSIEPPAELSLQAIQEDFETFQFTILKNENKEQLLEDIKNEQIDDDIDTATWFNFFNVFQSQQKDLARNLTKMQYLREELESQKSELESQKLLLQQDIELCLNNVRKAKSPE